MVEIDSKRKGLTIDYYTAAHIHASKRDNGESVAVNISSTLGSYITYKLPN